MKLDTLIYQRLRQKIYRMAYRQLGDHAASEDVVQDSFVRLTRYRDTTIDNMGGMLRVIARHLIHDQSRKRSRLAEEPLPDDAPFTSDEPSAEDAMLQRERVAQVSRIVEAMPGLRREVFLRRRLHDESARQVAEALGISPAAVDQHVARALLSIHKGLAEIKRDEDAA